MKFQIMHRVGISVWFAPFTGESGWQMKVMKILMVKAKLISVKKNEIDRHTPVIHRFHCVLSFGFAMTNNH